MIIQKRLLLFSKGMQNRFLRDSKTKLNCTWNKIIGLAQISRAMFYNYLSEQNKLTYDVFNRLIKASKINASAYSFETKIYEQNKGRIPAKNSLKFAEFIGIILGDGHLSKYKFQVVVTLNRRLELAYLHKLEQLFTYLFQLKPKIRFLKNKNAAQIYFYSKEIHSFLNNTIGLPAEKRTNKPNNIIPAYFFKSTKLLSAGLRGLFDTEGSLSIRHHNAIRLSIYNNSSYLRASIFQALLFLGYNPIQKYRSIRLNRTSEIIKFFNEIGSNNHYKLQRYLIWRRTNKLPNVNTAVL